MTCDRFLVWMGARIRRCTVADLGMLEWFGLFTPHRAIIRQAYAAQQHGDGTFLVLDVNGFPAGQVWVDHARARDRRTGLIWAMRVMPPFQSLGLGRRLLDAAEQEIRGDGGDWAELGVEQENAGALRFYRRAGYLPAGEEQGWYSYIPPGGTIPVHQRRDEIILRKRLTRGGAAVAPSVGRLPPRTGDGRVRPSCTEKDRREP